MSKGRSLYIVRQNRHVSAPQLLLNSGAENNLFEKDGVSPLYIACQNGHGSTAQLLLNSGADVNLFKKEDSLHFI